mmetsp:Transcript_35905/g.83241  ORF Transcript_35905/g.83241 Transcript_35905/m.83241 type:complete len:250 (+) Transcript_35905:1895-2644(+)
MRAVHRRRVCRVPWVGAPWPLGDHWAMKRRASFSYHVTLHTNCFYIEIYYELRIANAGAVPKRQAQGPVARTRRAHLPNAHGNQGAGVSPPPRGTGPARPLRAVRPGRRRGTWLDRRVDQGGLALSGRVLAIILVYRILHMADRGLAAGAGLPAAARDARADDEHDEKDEDHHHVLLVEAGRVLDLPEQIFDRVRDPATRSRGRGRNTRPAGELDLRVGRDGGDAAGIIAVREVDVTRVAPISTPRVAN